jgi:hypothetical protein
LDVLQQLKDAQQQVLARLHELEPLAREYETLKAEAQKLGVDVTQPARPTANVKQPRRRATSARRAKRARQSRPRPSSRPAQHAAHGGRREQIVSIAASKGPLKVADIAKELAVNPTGLYRTVNQLVTEGKLSKDGAMVGAVTATK